MSEDIRMFKGANNVQTMQIDINLHTVLKTLHRMMISLFLRLLGDMIKETFVSIHYLMWESMTHQDCKCDIKSVC